MTELEKLQNELKGYWADVTKLHEDLKAEKTKSDADVQTLKEADGLRKEQLETLTNKMNELELTIARHKDGMKAHNEPLDEKTEKLWEQYANRKGVKLEDLDRKAVRAAIKTYAKMGIKNIGPEQEKLLSTQDQTNGGYLNVPELDSEIDKLLADISGVRSVARVSQTATGVFEIVKRLTRPTVAVAGEGGNTSRSNQTYGKVAIPNRRYTARIGATIEEVQDSLWSIEDEARADVAEELDLQQGTDFVNGSGVNEPEGLWTNGDINEVNSGVAAEISYEGLIRVSHGDTTNGGFNRNYHRNARFAMNLVTLGSARLLEDGANNLIFQVGVGDIASTIAGFPYEIFPDAPNEGANTYPVMFGDFFKGYRIVDRLGMTFLMDPYTYAADGIVEYLFARRTGGKVVRSEVFRKLKCST